MKSRVEIEEVLKTLQEAHQWALRHQPSSGKAKIESLSERIGLLEYILGRYDES